MCDEKMHIRLQYIEGAIYSSRNRIKSGKMLNWISDDLRHATLHAMEVCLLLYGHEEDVYKTNNQTIKAFWDFIHPDLRSQILDCYVEADLLDSCEGNWKKAAAECIENVEKILLKLKSIVEK